jgi:hypothetical protein
MKFLIGLIIAAVASVVLAIAVHTPAHAAVTDFTPTTWVYGADGADGWHHPTMEPSRFVIGAGDLTFTMPVWSTWSVHVAYAKGARRLCHITKCGSGKATFRLSDREHHGGKGGFFYFRKMVVRWVSGTRHRKETLTFGVHGGTVPSWQ